jgi:hypothetical protein
MRTPDFVFVGHPRSGSGLVDGWLDGHPDLWMAQKELHYFGSDLRYDHPPRTLEQYLRAFADAPASAARVGEASTWTLCSEVAAAELAAFRPELSVIASLREPVSWLASLHSHLVFSANEDIDRFEDAIAAVPDRVAGRRVPPLCAPPIAVTYTRLVRYAAQIERLYAALGRDRVHVVILDDVKRDPAGQYRSILRFLGVREDFPGFDQVLAGTARSRNSNRAVRSRRVRDWIKQPEQQRVLRRLDPAPPGVELALRAIRRANIKYVPRDPIDPALERRLRAELRPEVERLEELLGRSLTGWK